MHFIYVTSDADKEALLSLGYVLLKEDRQRNMYVFQNKDTTFSSEGEILDRGIKHVLSDTLTF